MKKIVLGFVALTLVFWGINLYVNPLAMNARAVVHEAFFLNGVLAWGFMAMAIVIAARPAWLERITDTPLDELYRWHRTIGIWAAVLTFVHFFTKSLMQPVLAMMTLAPAAKPVPDPNIAGFDAFWLWLRGFSNTAAEWVTILGAVLFVISFVSYVRYHRWLTTHRLFSIIFIVVAIHAIRLMDAADYLTPFGLLNIAITIVGVWYSIVLLVRGAGYEKTVRGEIADIRTEGGLSLVTVRPSRALGVKPGEFVFLRSAGHEKHPFSVAGVNDDGTISFAVKALGDYTRQSVPSLAKGETVFVEGPWGHFLPDYTVKNQLWLAGGVGIAPFCAWLQDAAKNAHGAIRLVWCIKSRDAEPLFDRVEKLAKAAGVTLEVYESKNKRLNAAELFSKFLPEQVSLCASGRLAESVSKAYVSAGGAAANIRKEYFKWR